MSLLMSILCITISYIIEQSLSVNRNKMLFFISLLTTVLWFLISPFSFLFSLIFIKPHCTKLWTPTSIHIFWIIGSSHLLCPSSFIFISLFYLFSSIILHRVLFSFFCFDSFVQTSSLSSRLLFSFFWLLLVQWSSPVCLSVWPTPSWANRVSMWLEGQKIRGW